MACGDTSSPSLPATTIDNGSPVDTPSDHGLPPLEDVSRSHDADLTAEASHGDSASTPDMLDDLNAGAEAGLGEDTLGDLVASDLSADVPQSSDATFDLPGPTDPDATSSDAVVTTETAAPKEDTVTPELPGPPGPEDALDAGTEDTESTDAPSTDGVAFDVPSAQDGTGLPETQEDADETPSPFDTPTVSVPVSTDVALESPDLAFGFHFGVPLPAGALSEVGACRLVCGSDVSSASCWPMMHWPSEPTSVQWVGVAWPRPLTTEACVLEVLDTPVETTAAPALITDTDGVLTIDTGPLTVTLNPSTPDLLFSALGSSTGPTGRLKLQDTQGAGYLGETTDLAIELNTDQAAVIRLRGDYISVDSPGQFNAFEVRIYAYTGSPHLTVEHTLLVTSDDTQARSIASMTLELQGQTPLDSPAETLLFDAVDHAQHASQGVTTSLDHAPGALSLVSEMWRVSAGVRHAHEEYPKRLASSETDNGYRLVVDLWPAAHGNIPLFDTHPTTLTNELLNATHWFCVGELETALGVNGIPVPPCVNWVTASEAQKAALIGDLVTFPDAPVILSDFTGSLAQLDDFVAACGEHCADRWMIYDSRGQYLETARGVAKTHWVAVSALPKDHAASMSEFMEAVDAEPFVSVAPTVLAESGAFGRYHPATPDRFMAIEDYLEVAYDTLMAPESRLYGLLRFGAFHNQHAKSVLATVHGELNQDERYTGFYNQEAHDITDMVWWRYLRTGSRKAYVDAMEASRYANDLLVVWDDPNPGRIGLQRRHSMYPWSNMAPSHTLSGGLLTAHLITGQARYRQAVLLAGAAALAHYSPEHGFFAKNPVASHPDAAPQGTSLRGHTALWHAAINANRLNPGPEIMDVIQGFADTLVAVQKPSGLIPSQISMPENGVLYGKNLQGYAMSLSRAVADYVRFVNPSPVMADLIQKSARFQLAEWVSSDVTQVQARYFELLAQAYHDTTSGLQWLGGSPALLVGRELLEEAATGTPSAESTRFLGRGVGFLLHAAAHWEDLNPSLSGDPLTRGNAVFGAWQSIFLAEPMDIDTVEIRRPDGGDLRIRVAEQTDRWNTLHYAGRFISKWYGVNARLVLRSPDGQTVWCKDYFSCPDSVGSSECVLSSPCTVDAQIGVVEACALPNPVGFTDYRWPGDRCMLQVPPDGQVGSYELTVTDHPGISAGVDTYATPKKRNIAWWFESDAAAPDVALDGAVTVPLEDTFTFEAKRSRVCLTDVQGASSVALSSQNRFSGVAPLPGQSGPTASLYKLDLGWATAPELETFNVDSDGCIRVYSELNFGQTQTAARFTQTTGPPMTVAVGGVMHDAPMPLSNPRFDEGAATDGAPHTWPLNQGLVTNISLVEGNESLEGSHSVRLEGYVTLRQTVSPPFPGPWLVRYLANVSSTEAVNSCWVEVRQAYAEIDDPTSTYAIKPKCYPTQAGVSAVSCRFEAVDVHPVTGNPVELTGHAIRLGATHTDGDGAFCVFDDVRVLRALDAY